MLNEKCVITLIRKTLIQIHDSLNIKHFTLNQLSQAES